MFKKAGELQKRGENHDRCHFYLDSVHKDIEYMTDYSAVFKKKF